MRMHRKTDVLFPVPTTTFAEVVGPNGLSSLQGVGHWHGCTDWMHAPVGARWCMIERRVDPWTRGCLPHEDPFWGELPTAVEVALASKLWWVLRKCELFRHAFVFLTDSGPAYSPRSGFVQAVRYTRNSERVFIGSRRIGTVLVRRAYRRVI